MFCYSRILIALILFLLPSSLSLAQPSLFSSSPKEKDVTIDRAEFGFSGTVPPEAWTPITVWITGGTRGFSGALILEFNQDDTQPARIIVPAAATPGVSVPIEAVACLPAGLDTVTLTMVDQNGRAKAKATYSRFPGPRERQLVADTVEDQSLVLCVGRTSASRAFAAPRFISFRQSEDGGYVFNPTATQLPSADLVVAAADGARLPLSWAAYCGVEAVVVDADLSPPPDPRALDALRTWVAGGGRLVLVANSPGNLWRRWFPPGPAGDLVELQEVARHQTPLDLGDAVHATGMLRRADGAVYAADAARRDTLVGTAAPESFAAVSISGRLTRPTKRARDHGWTTRWAPSDAANAGLLAEGPVGLGWVTVLGVDPELAAAGPSRDTSASVWGDALRVALAGWLKRSIVDPAKQNLNPYQVWGWQDSRSAPDRESRSALTTTLNQVSTVPPVGRGVFWAIAACLALLALLVGPIDALVLKRLNLRHLSWFTALAWIGLASAGAYLVPGAIRTGRTAINRVQVIDVVDGGDLAQSAPTAWQTGVTGIFASQRGEMAFENAGPSSWWRGVSSRPRNPWERVRTTAFPALTTVQAAGDGPRANFPESVWQGQWTFRMFQDDGPLHTRLNAAVRESGGGFEVRVHGLPDGAAVAGAALRIDGNKWFPLVPQTEKSTETAGRAGPLLFRTEGTQPRLWESVPFGGIDITVYGLPGPRLRTDSLEALLNGGAYGAVYLAISGGPPTPGLNIPADYNQTTIARILVPLPASKGPADVEASPPAPQQGTTP